MEENLCPAISHRVAPRAARNSRGKMVYVLSLNFHFPLYFKLIYDSNQLFHADSLLLQGVHCKWPGQFAAAGWRGEVEVTIFTSHLSVCDHLLICDFDEYRIPFQHRVIVSFENHRKEFVIYHDDGKILSTAEWSMVFVKVLYCIQWFFYGVWWWLYITLPLAKQWNDNNGFSMAPPTIGPNDFWPNYHCTRWFFNGFQW